MNNNLQTHDFIQLFKNDFNYFYVFYVVSKHKNEKNPTVWKLIQILSICHDYCKSCKKYDKTIVELFYFIANIHLLISIELLPLLQYPLLCLVSRQT